MEILKKGSRGESVKMLQSHFQLFVDGIFGSVTEEAVKRFQQEHGLTADGIVGETTWKALQGNIKKTYRPIKGIILHCSATVEGRDYTVDTITQWHRQRGFATVGYHYIIYRDGTVHDGRDINKIGAHCEGHNTGTIGICYIGGLSADGKTAKDTRTHEQKAALVKLVKRLMNLYLLKPTDVHCHNEYAAKACPSFKIDTFRKEL